MTRSLREIRSGEELLYALGFTIEHGDSGDKFLAEKNGAIVEYIKDPWYSTVIEYRSLISNPYDYNKLEEDIFNMAYADIEEKYPQLDIAVYDDVEEWILDTLYIS